jgi:hypothetical protein
MAVVHYESWPQDRAAFERIVSRHEPCIFRGAAMSWELTDPLPDRALDRLVQLIGHRVVTLSAALPGDHGRIGTVALDGASAIPTTLVGKKPFREIASQMKGELANHHGNVLYAQSIEVDKSAPELRPYLKLTLDCCPATRGHWRLWVGTGDQHVNLHFDTDENFFCLLTGRKRFTVCEPYMLGDVYMTALEGGPYQTPASVVDPQRPDLDRYPRFAHAIESFEVIELAAGDVLYLPAHWWHHVESVGFNVAANYWWSDIDDHARNHAHRVFLRGLLELRPLPRHWRQFWRNFFDHFVFQSNGDPYEHLAAEHQGYAGVLTPEREAFIRQRLAEEEFQAWVDAIDDRALLTLRCKLSPAATIRVVSEHTIAIREGANGSERCVAAPAIAPILLFATPRVPSDVLSILAEGGQIIEPASFADVLRDLLRTRVLLPWAETAGVAA